MSSTTHLRLVLGRLRLQAASLVLADLPVPHWLQADIDWHEYQIDRAEGRV